MRGEASISLLIPKPTERTPFVPQVCPVDLPWVRAPLVPAERRALEAIVEYADLALVEDKLHLMIEATPELIDALATGRDRKD